MTLGSDSHAERRTASTPGAEERANCTDESIVLYADPYAPPVLASLCRVISSELVTKRAWNQCAAGSMSSKVDAGVNPFARTASSQASARMDAAVAPRPASASGSRAAARASRSERGVSPKPFRFAGPLQAMMLRVAVLPAWPGALYSPPAVEPFDQA